LGLKLNTDSQFYARAKKRASAKLRGRLITEHSIAMKRLVKEGRIPAMGKKSTNDKKRISANAIKRIKENGHPKGMLGKHHTEKFKIETAKRSNKMWSDPESKINSKESRQKISDNNLKLHKQGILGGINTYSRAKRGWYEKNGKKYFMRSGWELNYANYLDFLIKEKLIKKWEYEVDTFWFEKIKRGTRSYKPDFKLFRNDGTIEYHEVKGWMDTKSKTKLKRMRIYYPDIKILIIGKDKYKVACHLCGIKS
jgi:hypothetical protein